MSKDNKQQKSKQVNNNSSFGKNLEKILDELNIKKIDLAKAIGVQRGTITNITKGYNYPRIGTIYKICNYLNIDVEVLTGSDPNFELIAESSHAYSILKESLISIGALKEDEEIKDEHLELLKKLIKDNKKLYQEPDKALASAQLIVVPVETLSDKD
ncbi:MAG: helix-turn-helix transcriptional regulator [Clostridiales bacterium]|nr:helix-turn-helix transcriptional regulator [Clostridiales bacterium]